MTFHERPIKAHGWTGYGYSIIDPETGAGAYLIEGSGNGGFIVGTIYGGALAATIFLLGISSGSAKLAAGPILKALALELTSILIIYKSYQLLYGQETAGCFLTGVGVGMIAVQGIINLTGLKKLSKGLPGALAELLNIIISVGLTFGSSEPTGDCWR